MKETIAFSRRRRFERVLFLVDVKVLIEQEDRRNCAAQIFSTVVTVLDKCNELSKCSTLWGYFFFDSSRSPLASNTAIGRLVAGEPTRERFDDISQNLEKFGKVLEAVVASGDGYTSAGESRADCLVRTLAAVASDFRWDPLFASDSSSDEEMRTSWQDGHAVDLHVSEPNLVMLFSYLPTCGSQLARFLDLRASLVGSALEETLLCEFRSRFTNVQSVLDSKNIKCCWIDIPAGQKSSNSELDRVFVNQTTEQSVARRCLFELAWNISSLRLVANISNLLPLRLIWNLIAYLTPKFLDRRVVGHCEAHVRCSKSQLRSNLEDPAFSFSVEVQPWSSTVLTSSSVGYVSRLPRLCGNENLDGSELSSISNRVEIVILSKLSRSFSFQHSAERYLVLQKPSEALPFTDTGKIQSSELKAGEPSWPCLLISLESEESVALVTMDDGVCTCQAILEPFTPDSALLTVVDISGPTLRREPVPSSLTSLTQFPLVSKVSRIGLKEKLEKYAKGRIKLRGTGYSIKTGKAGAGIGDSNKFEESFDSTLLKVVKEKRRGCVLFKSVKKQRAECGKTLDYTHDCFQGSTSEPEMVSWQEYWRRIVKRLKREHKLLDSNCTVSSSLGVMTSSIDLPVLEQFSQNMVYSGVEETGTSVVRLEPVSDLDLLGRGSASTSQYAVKHVPSKSSNPAPSTPLTVGGDSHLSPTTFPDHIYPSFADSYHTSQSRSRATGDDMPEERQVPQTPTVEIPLLCTSICEEKVHAASDAVVSPCKTAMKQDAISEAAPGYSSIEQLVPDGLTSGGVDLHQFAKSVVIEAHKKLRISYDNEVGSEGRLASEADSSQTSDTSVAVRMKKLLLKRPKLLLSKYKQLLASAAKSSERKASVVGEKIREHELQIFFRLEILTLEGEFYDKVKQESFTREICQLLDNVQFHLEDVYGSEGGLQQYCDTVIVSRYKDALPSTVSKIFSTMELNGYCDPSLGSSVFFQTLLASENQPSSGDAVSQSENEATEPSSGGPGNSLGKQDGLLPNRSRLSRKVDCKARLFSEVNTSHSTSSSGKENVAPNVPHEQGKRQRKSYHFSSGAHNLLRVKAVKPHDHVPIQPRKIVHASRSFVARKLDPNTKVQATPVSGKEGRVLQSLGKGLHIVCQTPAPQTRRL